MSNYQDKKVVIIGLGMTGLSCVNFFIGQGVMPKVMDTRVKPHGLDRLPQEVERYLGGLNQRWLLESDLIICSPGVALSTPELQKAADAGIDIIGDIELFCREVKAPVIAITGSNGKSTVTTLLGEMAKQAGITVGIGGNIGLPALTLLTQPCQLYILELSSFQLETTGSLKAAAATVLNVTEDHMDRYPNGLKQYQRAKLRIYSNAESCIINHDDVLTYCPENSAHRCVSFGLKQGNYHLTNKEGETWLTVNNALILNCSEMGLSGQHNYTNALAAMALADSVDIPRISQLDTLRAFNGLAHRFQLVLQKDGVRWINDSKATNVGSTEAALNGLTVEGTLHLLLGGDGKSADFSPLSHYLQGNNIRTYCFGRDAEQLKALRPDIAAHTETLEQAMKMIASKVKPGDMVLLSPACASLDQFSSYEHRGDEFTRLAKELG